MDNKKFVSLSFERFDAKGALLDVTEYFEKGKIKLDFLKYGNDNKMTDRIGIFFSPSDALTLAYNIKDGRVNKILTTLKQQMATGQLSEKDFQYSTIWKSGIGGSYDKTRYRELIIQPGMKKPFVLVAQSGTAKEGVNGLVQPTAGPDTYIRIPMDHKELFHLAFALERAVRFCDDHMVREYLKEKYEMEKQRALGGNENV